MYILSSSVRSTLCMTNVNIHKDQNLRSEEANTKKTGIYTEYSITHHADFFRAYIEHIKIYCYNI